jgi:hypothetical protein
LLIRSTSLGGIKMIRKNPFTINPIKKKEEFIGRENLISDVKNSLLRQECCHIVGERKSGKTSFLYRMAEEFKKNQDIKFVFLDMQRLGSYGPEGILGRIASCIDENQSKEKMGYRDFENFIKNKKVILAFDEISAIVGNEKIDIGFFDFLRAISSNFDVVFLTTHRRGLYETVKTHPMVSSPFFNYFRNFHLGYLTKKESKELIQKGGKEFLHNYGGRIIERAYHHPFLLQLICLILFKQYKGKKEDEESIISNTEEEVYKTLEGHFRYWYDKSSEEEKSLLEKISRKENISAEEGNAAINLEKRLLVYRKNDRYHLVSPFFKKIIKSKEEKKEKEDTPISQYYWIILLFLVFGFILSVKMRDPLFLVFYAVLILIIFVTSAGKLIATLKRLGGRWFNGT